MVVAITIGAIVRAEMELHLVLRYPVAVVEELGP